MDISSPETINTPVIIDSKKSKNKLFVIVIAVILGLGGGGYWYTMIYQPAQYGKAVLALEAEIQSYGAQSGAPQFRWRYDYETAINALDKHEAFFTQFNKKIEDLNPPLFDKEMKELQENLLLFGGEFSRGSNNGRKTIAFVKEAIEIYKIFYPASSTISATLSPEEIKSYQPSASPQPQSGDLGSIFDYWELMMTSSKPHADKMFNQEPLNLGDVSFLELKSLWEEIYGAVQTVLPAVEQKYGRGFPVNSLPSPPELEKTIPGATSLDKIDEFLRKLESVIIRGGAEEIFRSALYPQSPELQSRSQSMNESLKKLREKYAQ